MDRLTTPQLKMTPSTNKQRVRILLQTRTHLVPGYDRQEKINFLQNKVCQLHWQRDFDYNQERYWLHHDYFGLKDIECSLLVDHHGYDHTVQEDLVPVVWYKWTGETL